MSGKDLATHISEAVAAALAQYNTNLPDNASNQISAADLRLGLNDGLNDALASLLNNTSEWTGWADYNDSTYTSGSPFAIAAATKTKLPNDGVGGVRAELPADYDSVGMYDSVGQVINGLAGDALAITIEYKQARQSGNGSYDTEILFDIGGAVGELYNRTISMKGSSGTADTIVFTTGVYCLDTWEANGAGVFINSDVAVNVYDIRYVIHRLHKGTQTYP